MTLFLKQTHFARMVAELLAFIWSQGYEVTFGDAYRDARVFGPMGVRQGYGESRSAHKQRLAIDLNLFKDGHYLTGTESHRIFGEFWESKGGTWGGRFNDGNHYSLEHDGVK